METNEKTIINFYKLRIQRLEKEIKELRGQLLFNIEEKAYYRKKYEILEDEFLTKTK